MTLQPGQYYPRMARPSDQNSTSAHGLGATNPHEFFSSARQFGYLKRHLNSIFDVVDPSADNFECYGNNIRNLLIIICTECENQMQGILRENGFERKNYATRHFIRLLKPMRLSEYSVIFSELPWLGTFEPFKNWSASETTKTLDWYRRYNQIKHDRENCLAKANLKSILEAFSALWILFAAQYGADHWRKNPNADWVIDCVTIPRWRNSDVYTYRYDNTNCTIQRIQLFEK